MILDSFQNIRRYSIPHLQDVIRFVVTHDASQLPPGEIEIIGRNVFARIAEYKTEPADSKRFEAHQIYADLQWMVQGQEMMQYGLETKPVSMASYESVGDIQFFQTPANRSSFLVGAGQFAVFFPGELHRPGCCALDEKVRVKKVVFKIKMLS